MWHFFLSLVMGLSCVCCFWSAESNDQPGDKKSLPAVEHIESSDSIVSFVGREKQKAKEAIAAQKACDQASIFLICYKNDGCLVRDTRRLRVSEGKNIFTFGKLFSGIIAQSPYCRTPKKGRIAVKKYHNKSDDYSKESIFNLSIGKDIFFQLENNKIDKGKLVKLSKNSEETLCVIEMDDRYFYVPFQKCIGVKKTDVIPTSNSIDVEFDSKSTEEVDVELSYLTSHIKWHPTYSIEVCENLDSVDVLAKAVLCNDTDSDIDNVNVIFDTHSPNIDKIEGTISDKYESSAWKSGSNRHNITLKKHSRSVCVLKEVKDVKPAIEHIMRIPRQFFTQKISTATSEIHVGNLLVIPKMQEINLNRNDGEVVVFRQVDGVRTFIGRDKLSDLSSDDRMIFEIDIAKDIPASVQQTDYKQFADGVVEIGIKAVVSNRKKVNASMLIMADVSSAWSIVKKNCDILEQNSKPLWKIELKPAEEKEIHFRIRINNVEAINERAGGKNGDI